MMRAALLYGLFALACLIAMHQTVFDLVRQWATSSAYAHGFFVAPLAAWMIAASPAPENQNDGMQVGLIISLGAALLWFVGASAGANLIEHIALIAMLIGGVGVVFGKDAYTKWAWPLGFLFLMVPFGEVLIPPLQKLTGEFIVALLSAIGGEVSLEGNFITTPAGVFHVAAACAGLKFLMTSIFFAALIANFSFSTNKSRVLFVVGAAALSIFANGVRASLLVGIATLTDMKIGVGPEHGLIGWVLFTFVFILIAIAGTRYGTLGKKPITLSGFNNPQRRTAIIVPLIVILAVSAAYRSLVIDRVVTPQTQTALGALSVPGWRILPPPDNWSPSLAHMDRQFAASYESEKGRVFVSIGALANDRATHELIGHDTRSFDGVNWQLQSRDRAVAYFSERAISWPISNLTGPRKRSLTVMSFYWLGDDVYADASSVKFAQMKAKLFGRNPPGGVVYVAASQTPDYNHKPIDMIRAFTSDAEPLHFWLERNDAGSR